MVLPLLITVQEGSVIIKPDIAQNKQTTFSTKTRIGIKLEQLDKCPGNHHLTLIKVIYDLKNKHV